MHEPFRTHRDPLPVTRSWELISTSRETLAGDPFKTRQNSQCGSRGSRGSRKNRTRYPHHRNLTI
jgi:hypothetical protein